MIKVCTARNWRASCQFNLSHKLRKNWNYFKQGRTEFLLVESRSF